MNRSLIAAASLIALAGCGSHSAPTKASSTTTCPASQIPIATKLPPENEITLKIHNGTEVPGLAEDVSKSLQYRGFKVQPVDPKEDNRAPIDTVAVISFGPKTVAAAQVVRAHFLMTDASSDSNMRFDLKNTSDVVAVVIGSGFRQLGAPTEVHLAIAALGLPAAPPGTCVTDAHT